MRRFATRDVHRGLDPRAILEVLGQTCFAGGRCCGAARLKDVEARLLCSTGIVDAAILQVAVMFN
jgi:hypothetical protein